VTLEAFEELLGGWHVVIMEIIADNNCSLMDFPPPYSHYDNIIRKLTSLYQESNVHGDICSMNIMVKKNRSQGFKLVDFDWSGRTGEVQYPMNVY
jgi:RIO-like serine/threonine protein kinase